MREFKTLYFWKDFLFEGQISEIEITVQANYCSEDDDYDVMDVIFDCACKDDERLLPEKYMDCVKIGDSLLIEAGHRVC